jgi:hypothetical protein
MSKRTLFVPCLALMLGTLAGYVDITTTEVQVPMLCILVFSFLLGLLEPKRAWLWAILISLSIPISTFVGLAINFDFADTPPRFPIFLAVLVIPALLAAYAGVFVKYLLRQKTPQRSISA